MKKFYCRFIAACLLLSVAFGAKATGWPANYQGVMLQGFYWDSNNETSWSKLTNQADELSQYFSLIWVPNSAKSNGMPAMGYMPIYWFTNHTSSFGSESQLKKMISTYKALGVGIIEDVVVNHRVGVSNYYDFPSETWNGKKYQLTNGAICSSDEMWREGGHGCPYTRGAADTGEDFNGGRDLDHTNATVQDHVKNYCKFLIDDLGYAGFRLDMVKGYGGQYTKIYNQYSKPQFSVGEYFDGQYDAVAGWIEATGRESAAFDFPFKFQVNNAFHTGNYEELVWYAQYTTPQPAGLIHYGYQQYAVTFVENHDTYRDAGCKLQKEELAANAFMLCSPGTPCVFWPHYTKYKKDIQALITVRNQVGVHNMSAVNVLQTSRDCYMAEVTGTKGKLIVRIGSASYDSKVGSGYTVKCSGSNYKVWSTTSGGVSTSYPATLHLMGHINGYEWATDKGISQKGSDGIYVWKNVTIDNAASGKGYISFATKLGSNWDEVNSSDRYGAAAQDTPLKQGETSTVTLYNGGGNAADAKSWEIAAGTYDIKLDLGSSRISLGAPGDFDVKDPESAVGEIDYDVEVPVQYFNLQGVRVENPTPGIYIMVKGNKSSKVVVN
ncbi:MAG: alpha-amylase [Muribaculaceae bacterium]|nr:alpha-amylase [Muribaculaceae bacterium]